MGSSSSVSSSSSKSVIESSASVALPTAPHGASRDGIRLPDAEVEHVHFTEKAILACPLQAKAWIELGRWNPISLLLLAPAWSYHLSGPADHWWFVARSACHMYYYVAQFCSDNGRNDVSGVAYLGMWAAISCGLQYPEAQWWYARDWTPCNEPKTKRELDRIVQLNPSCSYRYSWIDNNCQHFAVNMYEGTQPWSA
eukprot:TRINITY_DN121852_c0_g1_i1.p1 TRINITY_DN121852_c0_g1~~TRINITY_DN121852_c0_g1_i1.p1  ORF type:complete len:197 (-),score=7.31 TRINITY_DN121852_c0_g1_i1:219-809(-)